MLKCPLDQLVQLVLVDLAIPEALTDIRVGNTVQKALAHTDLQQPMRLREPLRFGSSAQKG